MATLIDTTISGNLFELPTGTTSQRPGSPTTGMIRYNTDINLVEYYNGTTWKLLSGNPRGNATGSVSTTDVDGYRIHTFTDNGNFEVVVSGPIEYLIVAGGGGGASHGGGGGAGGLIHRVQELAVGNYPVVVGDGARGSTGNDGNALDSQGSNSSFNSETAIGGGSGTRDRNSTAPSGGSGGGGHGGGSPTAGGSGTAGQGNDGADADSRHSAGGGAGSVPPTVVDGGLGVFFPQFTQVGGSPPGWFAGGGGAGGQSGVPMGGKGGLGGGGAGGPVEDGLIGSVSYEGFQNNGQAKDGIANTGGGGGGTARNTTPAPIGGDGGSGIVIIRYKI